MNQRKWTSLDAKTIKFFKNNPFYLKNQYIVRHLDDSSKAVLVPF